MFKKVFSLVLLLVMLVSINAFALTETAIKDGETTIFSEGAGMKVVLNKTATQVTADVYLIGEIKNITGLQTSLIVDTTILEKGTVEFSNEFSSLLTGWQTPTQQISGTKAYITHAMGTDGSPVSIASSQSVKFAQFTFDIVSGASVSGASYGLTFGATFTTGITKIVCTNTNVVTVTPTSNNDVFSFDASGLDSYNLSINTPANGIATLEDEKVAGGQATTLEVVPAVGYYIESVMAGTSNITSSFNAYRGGTAQYTPTADTAFTVTFAKIESVNSEAEAAGMTGVDAYTLPEVFRGKATDSAAEDVSVAFGQITPATGREVVGYGIYLTYTDGRDVTTMKPGVGPKFAANSKSADNQFGIIFEQIKPGSYNAQTYIEYKDGIVLGIKVPFTVAE